MESCLNVSLVAHVDHGKSTLSAKLIEYFKGIEISDLVFLDNLKIEKEKNITVRTQAISLLRGELRSISLLDTPGHLDFISEVIKSLSVSDLILLVVSLADGLQAQSIRYFNEIKDKGINFLWVISKIDRPGNIASLVRELWSLERKDIFLCSILNSKSVAFLGKVLLSKCKRTNLKKEDKLSCRVIASFKEPNLGYHMLVKNLGREIKIGYFLNRINSDSKLKSKLKIRKIYLNSPLREELNNLRKGEIGYIVTSLNESIRVGSILGDNPRQSSWSPQTYCKALIIPFEMEDYDRLDQNLRELSSNDFNLDFYLHKNPILGSGFVCKTSGNLHMEVVSSRLEEMGTPVLRIEAGPEYRIIGEEGVISSSVDLSTVKKIIAVEEEYSKLLIRVSKNYVGILQSTLQCPIEETNILTSSVEFLVTIPTSRISEEFEFLIQKCHGYLHYKIIETFWKPIKFKLLKFYANDVSLGLNLIFKVEDIEGPRKILNSLAQGMRRQETMINLQAKTGEKTLFSVKIKPYKKDVAGKTQGGGDISRRAKLLEAQKRGKKKLKSSTVINFDRGLFAKRNKGKK